MFLDRVPESTIAWEVPECVPGMFKPMGDLVGGGVILEVADGGEEDGGCTGTQTSVNA